MNTNLKRFGNGWFLSILIFVCAISYFLGQNVQYKQDQASTGYWQAKAQADELASNIAEKRADACETDPSSKDCNPMYQMVGVFSCGDQSSTAAAEVYWRFKNCTTPAPNPTPKTQVMMPSWCQSTINAYNAAYKPLGYSQGAINEILKKNNPECASY